MATDQFCPGLLGRELCESCSGRIPADQRGNVRVLHHPWPFDPCPHYCPPEEVADDIAAALRAIPMPKHE